MGNGIAKAIAAIAGSSIDLRILLIGLDAAGKTTMLYKLKLGDIVTTIPTIGFNVETLEYKNVNFTVWDLGSRGKTRALWRHYYADTQAVIWVIDSSDRERIEEVHEEMSRMLNEDGIREAAVLLIANKQDLPNAMTLEEIKEKLDLENLLRCRKWHIQPAVATTGDGLYESLEWLERTLAVKETTSGLMSWVGSFFSSSNPKEAQDSTPSTVSSSTNPSPPSVTNDPLPSSDDQKASDKPDLIQHAVETSLTSLQALRPYLPSDVDVNVYKSDSFAEYPNDDDLLQAFIDCENHPELYTSWNHLWLLRIIWIHLITAIKEGTARGGQVKLIIERVQNFYAKAPKSFPLPFHFTLLYFWIQLSDYCLRVSDVEGHDKEVYNDLVRFWKAHPWLLNDQLFTQYYSKKLILHTPQSMSEFMLPDVKPLPSIVALKPPTKT